MPSTAHRSTLLELLDKPDIPAQDIWVNMRELNTINTLLGGHRITLSGFAQLLGDRKEISICEIGCGGGDNLYQIYKYCQKYGIKAKITGIDANEHCIRYAAQQYAKIPATWLCTRYEDATVEPFDIVFNSLFCHHFTTNQLVHVQNWMQRNSRIGYFINDLERNKFAYYSIKFITGLVSKSYLVKNDAPISVLRGFTKNELQNIFPNAQINWRWAFRFLVVYKHGR
jgi:2-polyprenyl-3-methyl-5-hydroxy-6-metoxy-1,4-benzoquinol methylase